MSRFPGMSQWLENLGFCDLGKVEAIDKDATAIDGSFHLICLVEFYLPIQLAHLG